MAERPEADREKQKKALLISVGGFGGFHIRGSRLSLGWMMVSTVPSAIEDRLNAVLEENQSLRAELGRLSEEHARQLAHAAQENERLRQENQDLHQSRRRAAEQEEKLSQALAEIERLKAFMDRASSGMR